MAGTSFEDLTPHRKLQIEMAAKGCISGRLTEWPHLYRALESLGYPVTVDVLALEAKEWCCEILEKAKK
jgi:hypothetical protein